jgi:nucleoside-diphosphate-sugar epimerase
VKQLLERGYNVHGTVRNLHKLTEEEREEKYGPLAKLGRGRGGGGGGGQRERVGRQRKEDSRGPCDEGGGDGEKGRGCLTLFEADLRQPHSFDAAVRGCTYVFHVASPVVYASGADPEKDLLQPALEGVRNVLRAIQDSRREEGGREGGTEGGKERFKRLILTSSTGAVYGGPTAVPKSALKKGGGDEKEERLFTEADWNEECSLSRFPYYYSKVRAEREAWKEGGGEGGREGLDMVVICPSYVWGPPAVKGAQSLNAGEGEGGKERGREGGSEGGRVPGSPSPLRDNDESSCAG